MNRVKGLGDGGGRNYWWGLTPYSGTSSTFGDVTTYGVANNYYASTTWLSAPVCFRIS